MAEQRTDDVEQPVGVHPGPAAYGSDLVVDLLRALGTKYVPLNPGSSFRGLHDSLVNHGGNVDPQLLLCLHEEIAVSLAHGYAKGSGQVGVAAIHDLVGLMHASMAVYDAFCDRVPLLVLGGSGPVDPAQRRPVDWTHSATTQAQLVRDFVAWDAEPATAAAFVSDTLRAYQRAASAPRGPAYVSLDAGIQEAPLETPRSTLPDLALHAPAPPPGCGRGEHRPRRRGAAGGRAPRRRRRQPELGRRRHPGARRARGAPRRGVPRRPQRGLLPDHAPAERHRRRRLARRGRRRARDRRARRARPAAPPRPLPQRRRRHLPAGRRRLDGPPRAEVLEQRLRDAAPPRRPAARRPAHRGPAAAGCAVASLPGRAERRRRVVERIAEQRAAAAATLRDGWDAAPIKPSRLVSELWDVVRDVPHLLCLRNTRSWPEGVWELDGAGSYLGHSGGGGVGYGPGAFVGGALAARDRGLLGVGIIGDGDLLMAAGALWTAVHYGIPALLVVNDNGSFYNDEPHQAAVARDRGREPANSWIGMRIADPAIDIDGLAALLRLLDGRHRHRPGRPGRGLHQGARRRPGRRGRRRARPDGAGMSAVLGQVGRGRPPVHARMFIGGEWREAASGARIDCIDPSTEELLGTVPAGGAADADLAVAAAKEASGAWRALGWTKRAALLRDLAAAVAEVAEPLAQLDVLDSGNPIAGMRGDVESTVRELNYFAGLAGQTHGVSTPTDAERVSFTQREPYGVVAADRAVQPPVQVRVQQVRRPAGRGQRRDRQARRADLAVGDRAGRDRRAGAPARRAQRRHRHRRRARRRAGVAPAACRGSPSPARSRPAGRSCAAPRRTSATSPSSSAARTR